MAVELSTVERYYQALKAISLLEGIGGSIAREALADEGIPRQPLSSSYDPSYRADNSSV